MNYEPTPDKPERNESPGPTESHADSHFCSSNSQQSQQRCGHLKPSGANAIERTGLGRCNKPLSGFLSKRRTNDSEHKYYTCEYSYEGERWAIEIAAASWEDAEARLKRLAHGKVKGELKAIVPYKIGWLAKAWVWLRQIL